MTRALAALLMLSTGLAGMAPADAQQARGSATPSQQGDRFYCEDRKLGTWFYCERPKPPAPEPSAPVAPPPRNSPSAAAASLADLVTRARIASSTVSVMPAARPSRDGGIDAASADTRIGLEDTLFDEAGLRARSNAALVREAVSGRAGS